MSSKKGNDYFGMLAELIGYSCNAATLLNETLINFDASTLEAKKDEMHKIEHEADLKKHEMMDKLSKEFITPIERGDLIDLAHHIDDVTDAIEDILVRVYMYDIKEIKEEAQEYSKIIIKVCDELKVLVEEFRYFKKSTKIDGLIVYINDLEEEGDKLYVDGMRKFFTTINDPMELLKWKNTYEYFEKCCDACEDVAHVIQSVVMKNS